MVEFDFSAVPSQILMGSVPVGILVYSCVVEVDVSFGPSVSITVGDMAAQGRFQAAADNSPGDVNQYERESHFSYSAETDAYVFISGTATTGHARVILYLE